MQTIEKWYWAFNCRIRGEIAGEGYATKAVESVDPATREITVRGGEKFKLGEKAEHEERTIEQLAELVRSWRSGNKGGEG